MKKLALFTIAVLFAFSACKKEKNNTVPTISGITVTLPKLGYNEISTLTVNVKDEENDVLTYEWSCTGGFFASASNKSTVSWRGPEKEGIFECTVVVSDGKESVTSAADVEVMGIFYDDFTTTKPKWGTYYADAYVKDNAVYISGNSIDYYGLLLYEFTSSINPGYYVNMNIGRNSTFLSDQEYFAELEFESDEEYFDILACRLLIFPANTESNWVLICFIYDKTTLEGEWLLVDENSLGKSAHVKKGIKEMNKIEFKIDVDKDMQVKINDYLLCSTSVFRETEEFMAVPLKLNYLGAGTLDEKEIIMTNVIVRENGAFNKAAKNSNKTDANIQFYRDKHFATKNIPHPRTLKSYLKDKLNK